jgi:hypothetical protein
MLLFRCFTFAIFSLCACKSSKGSYIHLVQFAFEMFDLVVSSSVALVDPILQSRFGINVLVF